MDNCNHPLNETANNRASSIRGFFLFGVIQTAAGEPSAHSNQHLQQIFEETEIIRVTTFGFLSLFSNLMELLLWIKGINYHKNLLHNVLKSLFIAWKLCFPCSFDQRLCLFHF